MPPHTTQSAGRRRSLLAAAAALHVLIGLIGTTADYRHDFWLDGARWIQPNSGERLGLNNSVHVVQLRFPTEQQDDELPSKPTPGEMLAPYFNPPAAFRDGLGSYRSPLIRPGEGGKIDTAAEWLKRREELRSEWEALLGPWPPLIEQPAVEFLSSQPQDGYIQHWVRFKWLPDQATEGWLLVPDQDGPYPAVLTVYYEPDTAIGQGAPHRDFALQLVKRGFVCLSIGTTEATQAKTYGLYYPTLENSQAQSLSMLAYAAANAWYVLASLPEVDAERIGIVGHSFGGKWAMFASCLFGKFACAAWSDAGIVFDEGRPNVNYWEPWYLGYHPPPWRERGIITEDNPARF